jgi:signal transduction histidine kinase
MFPMSNKPSPDSSRRDRELEAARKISQALFQRLKVEELVEESLQTALDVVDGQAGCVLLANADSKQLVFYCAKGDKAPPKGTGFPWHEGIAGTVFKTGEPVVTGNVKGDTRHFQGIDRDTGFDTHDMIALPLKKWEGEPIGVLEVLNKKEGRLNEDDVAILTIIASFTAMAVEQARLYEDAKLAEVVRVLGDIGHDVKNMLMPVLTGASLLKTEIDEVCNLLPTVDLRKAKASQEMCHEILEMVDRNARRIQDRVKEIADCVKGLCSPPNFSPCKMQWVISQVIDMLQFSANEKGIVLLQEGLEELPAIQADERRLFNAFYNLVNNAIWEVPAGGSVTIQGDVDSATGGVCVRVKDTGRGMPAEIRNSLFSASAISRKAGGTGLGTKIVKDVVDAHSGQISVESEVNVGTTFFIHLPMTPEKPSSASAPPRS